MHLVTRTPEKPAGSGGEERLAPQGPQRSHRGVEAPAFRLGRDVHSLPSQTMAMPRADAAKEDAQRLLARRVSACIKRAGAFFPNTPNAMMTRCSAADFLGGLDEYFTLYRA